MGTLAVVNNMCRFRSVLLWRFLTAIALLSAGSIGWAQNQTEECTHEYGFTPDSGSLQKILSAHKQWLFDPDTGARADLCRMNLAGIELEEADLRRAKLEEADLRGAKLRDANLEKAHMHRADLAGADLTGASMVESLMRKTNLVEANLAGANLRGVNLRKSIATRARFNGANLTDANLSKVDFEHATLIGANLQGASLRKARLIFADLREANLDEAKVRDANLTSANLVGASLLGADFKDAVLNGTNVYPEQLSEALGLTDEQVERTVQAPGNVFAAENATRAVEPEVEVVGATVESQAAVSAVEVETEALTEEQSEVVSAPVAEPAVAEPAVAEPAVATVAEPAAETVIEPPSIAEGSFLVQLGSYRVERNAHNLWDEIKTKHSVLFDAYTARVVEVDLDSGKWHRLRAGPFQSRQAAIALCTHYQEVRPDAPCVPVTAGN